MPLPTAARRPLHRFVAGLAVASATVALAVAAPAAQAAAPGPHDPFGGVSTYKAVTGGIQMNGWAVDPDAPTSNVPVFGVVDGRRVTDLVMTSLPNSAVTTKYQAGPTPGYSVTIPLTTGNHVACLVAHNALGTGFDTVQKCVATPIGSSLSSAQLAARSPVGTMSGWVNPTNVHFVGWATDPDFTWRPTTVVLYVDGQPAVTVNTHWNSTNPLPAGAGRQSTFDIVAPVSPGAHLGCIWLVNVGLGANRFLGCRSGDTRGPAGTSAVTTPALNSNVIAEAKRHIGQKYVWGATGPTTFDCSGLVVYSYTKYGFKPVRTSEQQFTAARLIPASRAVPGDLVFTHDSVGDVYHVGIYYGPGTSVAAIDEAEGVNYQRVWDPSSTTYGSFTHT